MRKHRPKDPPAAQPASEPKAQPERLEDPDESVALVGARSPIWDWQQILSSPRIGGRLTAVAVDPTDSKRIFVGTEEGTLVRSVDGGITWDERPLSPFVIQARSVGLKTIDAPDPADASSATYYYYRDPPDRFYAADLPFIATTVFGDDNYLPSLGFPPYILDISSEVTLLSDVVASRIEETVPVGKIAICPGATYPLLVSTPEAVYGSADDGLTSMRLFFITGNVKIAQVACSPWNRNEIVVASDDGLFRSTDGGISFAVVLTADPGQNSTAAAFGRNLENNKPILYDASEASIYAGDPDSSQGLEYLYPNDDDSENVPYDEIRWIEATPGGEVWLATDDGVRLSRDNAKTFINVEPRLFGGQKIPQVIVDANERVAVMMKDHVYISDDEGATWHPFFHGITKRTFRQMASAQEADGGVRWWVVTSGELWTRRDEPSGTAPPAHVDRQAQAWARARLKETPTLQETIDRVLDTTRLSPDRIEELAERDRQRTYIPLIDVKLTVTKTGFERAATCSPFCVSFDPPLARDPMNPRAPTYGATHESNDNPNYEFMIQATWPFYETRILTVENGTVRASLYELRRQIAFAAEDAWHEREMHLLSLARGMSEPQPIAILKARIDALDAVLDVWGWKKESGR